MTWGERWRYCRPALAVGLCALSALNAWALYYRPTWTSLWVGLGLLVLGSLCLLEGAVDLWRVRRRRRALEASMRDQLAALQAQGRLP